MSAYHVRMCSEGWTAPKSTTPLVSRREVCRAGGSSEANSRLPESIEPVSSPELQLMREVIDRLKTPLSERMRAIANRRLSPQETMDVFARLMRADPDMDLDKEVA